MTGHGRGLDIAAVALAATAVQRRIAVQQLAPGAAVWHPNAVVVTWHWCEVAHDRQQLAMQAAAQIADHALFTVGAIDPLEALVVEVARVQRGTFAQDTVEIAEPVRHAAMEAILEQMPIEALVVIPLVVLT